MHTQISKWGHSLAVRIPKAFAQQARLMEGQEIEMTVTGSQILLTPVRSEYSLQALLDGITAKNLHRETNTGRPVGQEQW